MSTTSYYKGVPYMQISDMILGVKIIGGKVSVGNVNGVVGFVSVLKPQPRF